MPSADASLTTSVFTVPASGATLSYSQYIDTDFPPQADVGSIVALSAATNLPLVDGDVALNIEGTSQEWTKESLPFRGRKWTRGKTSISLCLRQRR